MPRAFLDSEAKSAFKRAIETIESASAVEVVVAFRQSSGSYRHANAIVGALVAALALGFMLFGQASFGLTAILVDPFLVGLLAAVLVEAAPDAKRLLTSSRRRRHDVLRAGRATFVERRVHATTGRSGLLLYISWLERRVALVPDLGLAAALPADVLARAEADLGARVVRGGAAVADALAALAPALAAAMPHREDDVNELPDAVDDAPEST